MTSLQNITSWPPQKANLIIEDPGKTLPPKRSAPFTSSIEDLEVEARVNDKITKVEKAIPSSQKQNQTKDKKTTNTSLPQQPPKKATKRSASPGNMMSLEELLEAV